MEGDLGMDKTKEPKKLSAAQIAYLQDMIASMADAEREHEVATLELSIAREKADASERVKNIINNTANNFIGCCARDTGLLATDFAPETTPGKWTFLQEQMAFVYTPEEKEEGGAE